MLSPRSATRRPVRSAGPITLLILLTTALLALVLLPGAARAATTLSSAAPGGAWIRVGHFVPGMDATTISITPVGGTAETMTPKGGLSYGHVSSYRKLAPGSYTATVRDGSAPAGSAPLLSTSFRVGAGQARTVAVVGTSAEPRLVLLTDDLAAPKADTARVRLLQASSDDAVTVTAVDGPVVARQVVLGQTTGYTSVPAGSWRLELQTSTTSPSTAAQSVSLASGSVYTVVVLDDGSAGVRLKVVTDAAGAVAMPQGGAHTGGGGTALGRVLSAAVTSPDGSSDTGVVALTGGLLLVGAVVVLARRRRPAPRGR